MHNKTYLTLKTKVKVMEKNVHNGAIQWRISIINLCGRLHRWHICVDVITSPKNQSYTKTEFIWSATSRRNHLVDHSPISISGTQITPSPNVKLLGVHIDEWLSLSVQISRTVSSGFFHLRRIKAIRRCLPSDAAISLVNAFVVSRLDYCNSIYAGLPKLETNRLQTVYNVAATLIFGASGYSRITPLPRDRLHWLQCTERIHLATTWSPPLAAMYRADTSRYHVIAFTGCDVPSEYNTNSAWAPSRRSKAWLLSARPSCTLQSSLLRNLRRWDQHRLCMDCWTFRDEH